MLAGEGKPAILSVQHSAPIPCLSSTLCPKSSYRLAWSAEKEHWDLGVKRCWPVACSFGQLCFVYRGLILGYSSTLALLPQEDVLLRRLIKEHGVKKWSSVAEGIPGRSGKSCRLR